VDTGVIIAIVVIAAVVIIGFGVMAMMRGRESKRLRERFGPEYEQTVSETGRRREAEQELAEREKRVEKLRLREIEPEQRTAFAEAWRTTQTRFVDDPANAVREADTLVQRVMDTRGYPISNFEQQAADISVDHPEVVTNYRAAHKIAEASSQDKASTEDLRQAMVHYRALFSELLGVTTPVS
jgi:hypothetical protein